MTDSEPRADGEARSRQDRIRVCLDMIKDGTAYNPPPMPGMTGPLMTPAFRDALFAVGDLDPIRVKCSRCNRDLGRWELRPGNGVAMPLHRPPKKLRVSPDIVAYTDKLAAGKGQIVESATNDARGTIAYECQGCGLRTELRAETRTRRFLEASLAKRQEALV